MWRASSCPIAAALCALVAASSAACGDARPADPPLLELGGQVVRRSAFEAHVKRLEARGGTAIEPQVKRALLEPFLEERLLALEARRRGLVAPDASEVEEQAAVKALLDAEVLARIEVSESDVAAHYAAHSEEFTQPERRSLRQILLATENEARDTRRRLERDPRAFELLARSRSKGPEAQAGGQMGIFARGQLPRELEQAAFALPVGGVSQVVSTPLGFHVLRVDALDPARQRGLDECRAEIHKQLLQRRSDESVRQFVRALSARAKVNHDAALVD